MEDDRREGSERGLRRFLRLRRAIHLVWSSAPGWTAGSAATSVILGLVPIASMVLTKLIVDAIAAGMLDPSDEAARGAILRWLAVAAGLAVLGALAQALAAFLREGQSLAVTDHVSELLNERSCSVDLAFYENPRYFDRLHRAQRDAAYRPTSVVNGLVTLAHSAVSLVAISGLVALLHWGIALALLLTALPLVLVRVRFSRRLFRWQRHRTPLEREASYLGSVITGAPYAKELRIFGLGPWLRGRFAALRRALRRERLRLTGRRAGAELVARLLALGAWYGSYLWIAFEAVDGRVTIGDVVMYFQAIQRIQGTFQEFLSGLARLYEDDLFLRNFYEFLDLEPAAPDPPDVLAVPRPFREGIEVRGLSFAYPGTGRRVLEDVSFRIGAGEHVALVGANGGGKSTLIKLLCRLYEPTQGEILLDGRPLPRYGREAWRRALGVLFQDHARYAFTAAENVRVGDVERPGSDRAAVREAAREAGVLERLEALPKGLDTRLGRWFEDGEELSLGEWQKVALARAFLRDSAFLMLDEPSSSLDARAEAALFDRFHELARGRTALFVSHRFSTVRRADRILVLDGGRLVEQGSHDELVRRRGLYARLFEVQARPYR